MPKKQSLGFQRIPHYPRVCGKLKLCKIDGQPIFLDNAWSSPQLPKDSLAVNAIGADDRFEVLINDHEATVSLVQSEEEILENKLQVVFVSRQDPETKLDYLVLSEYELRATTNWR
jgi:hypothetical protein